MTKDKKASLNIVKDEADQQDKKVGLSITPTGTKGGLSIGPKVRQFTEEYFSGDFAGNATRSFMQVWPETSYDVASVEASALLKKPEVREFLAELHERITEATAGALQPWTDLLPSAQQIIVATSQGRLRSRLAFEAAVYVCNRTPGSPTATSEVHVVNHAKVAAAITAFSRRLAQPRKAIRGTAMIASE